MKTMNDLCVGFLQDIYYAERQILKALPKMVKAAENPQLKEALTHHREQTEHHVERLQKVFEEFGKPARAKTCEAIQGILEEGDECVRDFEMGAVRDAGIIANAQAVEHYEMARYLSLISWANTLGKPESAKLLQETLAEEQKADSLLKQIAGATVGATVGKAPASKAVAA
jgi:ferritin-like metal-binding protein YciE